MTLLRRGSRVFSVAISRFSSNCRSVNVKTVSNASISPLVSFRDASKPKKLRIRDRLLGFSVDLSLDEMWTPYRLSSRLKSENCCAILMRVLEIRRNLTSSVLRLDCWILEATVVVRSANFCCSTLNWYR
jgi:hypothetical protein